MMADNLGQLAPLKRGNRPVGGPSGFTIHHLASDNLDDRLGYLRQQVLTDRHQLDPGFAVLVASLVFGEVRR